MFNLIFFHTTAHFTQSWIDSADFLSDRKSRRDVKGSTKNSFELCK